MKGRLKSNEKKNSDSDPENDVFYNFSDPDYGINYAGNDLSELGHALRSISPEFLLLCLLGWLLYILADALAVEAQNRMADEAYDAQVAAWVAEAAPVYHPEYLLQ